MLRLAMPTEPTWHDLPHGVRVLARPLTTALYQAALAASRREVERLEKAEADIVAAGGAVAGLPGLDDPDLRIGLGYAALARNLARFSILAWEGVAEADGAPAPLTPENAARLVETNVMAEALVNALLAPLNALVAEGNG